MSGETLRDRLRGRSPLADSELFRAEGPGLHMLCRQRGCLFEVEVSDEDPDASQSEFVGHARRVHPRQKWQDVLMAALVVRALSPTPAESTEEEIKP